MKWRRLTSLWTDDDYSKFEEIARKRHAERLRNALTDYMGEATPVVVGALKAGQVIPFDAGSGSIKLFDVPVGYAIRLRVLQCLYYTGALTTSGYIYWGTGVSTNYLWYTDILNDFDIFQGTKQYAAPNSYQSVNDMVGLTNLHGKDGKPLWYLSNYTDDKGAFPFERVVSSSSHNTSSSVYAYRAKGAVKVLEITKLEF